MGEIAENCPGVKLVLVALKCDLREAQGEEDGEAQNTEPKRPLIDYKQGLAVAEKIRALRYLGTLLSRWRFCTPRDQRCRESAIQ